MYTKQEVQDLINKIIHHDSFADIHYFAQQIMKEHDMVKIDPSVVENDWDLDDPDMD